MSAAQVITIVRHQLQDEEPEYRYDTADIVIAMGSAYDKLKERRPDLFIGRLVTDAALPITDASDLSFLGAGQINRIAHEVAAEMMGAETDEGMSGLAKDHHQLAREL